MHRFLLCKLLILILLPLKSTSQPCEITAINATALPCNGNYFSVSVNIEGTNTSPGFTLAGNGVIYGTFLYDDLPVTVGPLLGDNESQYEFIAWDVENPDCQQFTTLQAADCGPICDFSNAFLDSISCVNNNFALVELDFVHEGTSSNVFRVYYENGTEVGTWLYESLPVTITSFAVNGSEPINLTICDGTTTVCCETFAFDAIDCNPNNCEIYNVTVDPECTGNNFVVHLDFDYNNVASDSFTIVGNNLNYGLFGYNELPLTLGPLNGGTTINWEFVIRDSENGSCQKTEVLGIYNCPPPCDVSSLIVDPLVCESDTTYTLLLEMEIEGEGENGFSIFSETTYYGSFSYEDLPITLQNVGGADTIVNVLSVCDNETPGCCGTLLYESLLCSGCLIYNLSAVPQPCNAQNEIYVSINFDYQNTSAEGFSVSGNGNHYGDFTYDELPVEIGPFPGDSSVFLEFVVADLQNTLCFDSEEIGLLACGDICNLSNLVVETGDCTGNNTYNAVINFDFENVIGGMFDLFINDEFYETYNYSELPLTLEEFPSSGNNTDIITVCDNNDTDCCTSLEFPAPDCECNIYEATTTMIGCLSDSTFAVSLEFFYENLPGDFVDVYFDGVFNGFFSVNDIPLTIILQEGTGTGVLSVNANDLESCSDQVVVELMMCDGPPCSISELDVNFEGCQSDSTYAVAINFESISLPTDSVVITSNGLPIGTYAQNNGHIVIQDFPLAEANQTVVTVCAQGAPDCCASYEYETPFCPGDNCAIDINFIETGDCSSDTTYLLVVDFDFFIPSGGDSVVITANEEVIGTFHVSEGHITIEHFPLFPGETTNLSICAQTTPDCCDSFSFETPGCGGCSITDLVVNFEGCQTDSTYTVAINFESNNLPGDSVIITANDQEIGQFAVNNGHIVLEGFPVLPSGQTNVTVCAVGAPDCCDSFEYATPSCGGGGNCEISELEAHLENCLSDSTYVLAVNFNADSLPVDSISIVANAQFIGNYPAGTGHLLVENFPVFPSQQTVILVCAIGVPNCCQIFEFNTPVCDSSCNIVDLFAEIGACTSDSTFVVDLVYEEVNLPGDSVTVYANDSLVGNFFNAPDFIHIEHFPLLPGETTVITVCAVGAPDCCDTYTIENPLCGENCDIFGIVVDVLDCTSDTTFGAVISFQHENITGDGFDVWVGDQYLGLFNLEQIPVVTSSILSNSTGNYNVTICENDNASCCESLEFDGPICDEECQILNLEWSLTDCDEEDNFYFVLDFDFINVGDEGFVVAGNGTNYGTFSYDSIPLVLGPFVEDNTVYEFLVFDALDVSCFAVVVPGIIDCTNATNELSHQEIFTLYNNGTSPGILALKEIELTLFNSNGKVVEKGKSLSGDSRFELNKLPAGIYIGSVIHEGNVWTIKMVKSAY